MVAGQYSTTFTFRGLTFGSTSAIFTAPGYKADTMVVTVDSGQLTFGSVPTTLGPNQTAQMYVTLPFTNDSGITVNLASSAPGVLSVPATATIPARATYGYFNVTGVATGTATVTATAPGKAKSGTSASIPIGTPKLQIFLGANTSAGQRSTLTVYAEDSLGAARNVSTPLTITLASTAPTHTVFDSASITIPVGAYYVSTGIMFDTTGSYRITAAAPGYPTASASSATTGALVRMASGNVFSPNAVIVKIGEYVTWRNNDLVGHSTTEDSATPVWNSGVLAPGGSYQVSFSKVGPVTYHCTVHNGMTGTILVNP
jgi:plastocyanin